MIRRRHLLTPLALTAALTLSACGAGGGDVAPLSQADFFSQTARAQKDDASFHISGSAGSGQEAIKLEGDVQGAEDPKDVEFAVTGKAGSTDLQFRFVDEKLYINAGKELGDKFLVLDPDDSSNPIAQQFGQLTSSFDPAQTLAATKDAVTDFQAGEDTTTIDGVETRPYTLTIDTAKALEIASKGQDIPQETLSKLPKTVKTVVWVGSDDKPRRIRSNVAGEKLSLDFSQWGEPVEVEKPSASQIEKDNPFASAG